METTIKPQKTDESRVLDFLRENDQKAFTAYELMQGVPALGCDIIKDVLAVLGRLEKLSLITETSRGNGLKRWKIV